MVRRRRGCRFPSWTPCCPCSRPAAPWTRRDAAHRRVPRRRARRRVRDPVLVVAEEALRARAREYAAELAARWPRSRVVFASKAFPCTAVQRVMVEEGLGLDVAGRRRDRHRARGRRGPGAAGAARQRQERRGDRDGVPSTGSGSSSSTTPTTSTGSRRPSPAGRTQDVLVRVIPGVEAADARERPDRARGLQVRAGAGRGRRADRPDRAQPAAAHAGSARARRLADPRRRAVRAIGGAARGARRVPGLRPRRRPGRALHLRRPAAQRRATTSTRSSGRRASTCRPDAELIIEPGRSMVASAAATLYRVVTVKRGEVHVRRRRRRHGRQPRGRALRPALRGRDRRPARRRPTARR